jgi:hypothetical protein
MTWNKKNDQFALSCGLRPSSRLLLRWLLRRAKLNQVCEIEIDLRIFNSWIAKNRNKAYDPKTIREAIAQLDDKTQGLILISKSYSPWVKKILIRPLEMLEKKFPKKDLSPKLQTVESMFGDDRKKRVSEQQQQDISKIKHLFGSLGLKYTEDAIYRLWRYAGKKVDSVQKAVEYMLYCHGKKLQDNSDSEGIPRPHGWLNECLKYGWHQEAGFYVDGGVELPYFGERGAIAEFIDGITRLFNDCQRLQT